MARTSLKAKIFLMGAAATVAAGLGPAAWADTTTNGTTWYLRSTSASAAFGTTGPSAEYSAASDLVAGSPTSKTTALAMTDTPGSAQASVAGAENVNNADGKFWFRTFLSPKLAAQTINSGATFRLEAALQESAPAANMTLRVHVYQWREGTGYVASLIDTVGSADCGVEPLAASSERNEICVTAGLGSNVTLQDGDQLAVEVWVRNDTANVTSYTGTLYFEGTGFIEQGTANGGTVVSSAMSQLSVSQTLTLSPDLRLADHGQGQIGNSLIGTSATKTDAELSRFKLTNIGGSKNVTQLVVNLSDIAGILQADVTGAEIIVDANGDGTVNAGETTAVGGAGAVSISGATGTITFSSAFTVSAATSYIVRADLANLANGDQMLLSLPLANVTSNAGNPQGSVVAARQIADLWRDASWMNRRKVTLAAAFSENLANFPVLIKLDSSRIDYAKTQNSGQDIRFVDPGGSSALAHQIEKWDEAGTSYVWVKVPQIDADSTTDYLWMYYNKSSAADGQNATAVWDANFKGVWHLSETSGSHVDSTSNPNDSVLISVAAQGSAAGKIDGADSFTAASSHEVDINDHASLGISGEWTLSAWIRKNSNTGYNLIVDKSAGSSEYNYYLDTNGAEVSAGFASSTLYQECQTTAANLDTTSLYHVVATFNDAANQTLIYVNGAQQATTGIIGGGCAPTVSPVPNAGQLVIGEDALDGQSFDGVIDEVRVAAVTRSAAWISADYKSTSDTLASYGSEDNVSSQVLDLNGLDLSGINLN